MVFEVTVIFFKGFGFAQNLKIDASILGTQVASLLTLFLKFVIFTIQKCGVGVHLQWFLRKNIRL